MEAYDTPVAAVFAARLKALRVAASLTMAELGNKVVPPMHAPAIARYESGKNLPSWGAVVRLASALGVTPNAFLERRKAHEKDAGRPKRTRKQ